MPSSSDCSDLRLERIIAREEHHRRNGLSPSDTKGAANSTEYLGAIGSHFQLPNKQDSWPKSIEDLTDDEWTPRESGHTLNCNRTSLYPGSDHKESPPNGSTLTPTRTRNITEGTVYLPRSEIGVLRRWRNEEQLSKKVAGQPIDESPTPTRQASPCTTVEHGPHDEEAPPPRSRAHTAFSTSHTPSHRSLSPADEDTRSVGEGPSSPRPWSEYDQKNGKTFGSHKE